MSILATVPGLLGVSVRCLGRVVEAVRLWFTSLRLLDRRPPSETPAIREDGQRLTRAFRGVDFDDVKPPTQAAASERGW